MSRHISTKREGGEGPEAGRERLKAKEDQYRELFFHSPAVIIISVPERGDILDANPAASRFYGYSAEELRGMTIWDIDIEEPEVRMQQIQRTLAVGRTFFFSQHRLRSGEVRDVEVHPGLIQIEDRDLTAW
jgi:PAS domain S-box-containing protein